MNKSSRLLLCAAAAFACLGVTTPARAYPETYAAAVVGATFAEDWHWVYAPAVPDSSTATMSTGVAATHADAFNTGKLGASAATTSTRSYSVARITDSLYLNLPQAVPGADGMILRLQFHGSMSSNWNASFPDAAAQVVVTALDQGLVLANACLVVQNYPLGGLWAPPLCDGAWLNDFLEPQNASNYPAIGNAGHAFTLNAPLYLILKGVTPAAFNGKEITLQIWTTVEGPASANFLNTLQFDAVRPFALYASATQTMIPLPEGSVYHSGAGMGVSLTPVVVPPPPTLDVDASGSSTRYDATTDGLIILRHLFGLSGASLTGGALGATATRTDPAAMKTYLDGFGTGLDVDGNGTADALTDGLLILRYLRGLRGDALIAGVVGPSAIRKLAGEIEPYIQSLMP